MTFAIGGIWMAVPQSVMELIAHFRENIDAYKTGTYNETQTRIEFIDPLFEALGWDIANKSGYSGAYKDVVHEDAIKVSGSTKAPDYAFRVGGIRKFFLEAKKPSTNIKEDASAAYQLRRYAWSAKLPISILTDFEELSVYDCRIPPKPADRASVGRIRYLTFEEYPEVWNELVSTFSREAILKGAFDKYVQDTKQKRGTTEVDDAFLEEIESWREVLARNLALRNPGLTVRELNTAVQRTIDRIVFLRIAEDRGIEPYGRLRALTTGNNCYKRLTALFRQADGRYNSGLFHFREDDGVAESLDAFTLELAIDDKILQPILKDLYYPDSPYEFSVLPGEILGQVYEQFLGKIITLHGRKVEVEEKPELKKAGGIYYTPDYVVRYIVSRTLPPFVDGKTPAELSGTTKKSVPFRVLDPACGSGSFLIQAYQFLLDWYRSVYLKDDVTKYAKGKNPQVYQDAKGEWRLTIAEKRGLHPVPKTLS
jgi:predicted type IV restriction endonuclease